MAERKAGRPPKYENAAQLQAMIDAYFAECKGRMLTLEDGTLVRDRNGLPVMVDVRPPTITGLALALGFTSRQALLNYQAKKEFVDTVTRAKARVEMYTEERLFDKDGANGAKFSLYNNFRGWKESKTIDGEAGKTVINVELKDE